ncbi:MAG: hypothetical protein ACWA6U_18395 [Breznakibacter sp.]
MNKDAIIKKTIQTLNRLPIEKVNEVHDYADYLLAKLEDNIVNEGIRELSSTTTAFDYLNDEEDLYTVNDLKERYK